MSTVKVMIRFKQMLREQRRKLSFCYLISASMGCAESFAEAAQPDFPPLLC